MACGEQRLCGVPLLQCVSPFQLDLFLLYLDHRDKMQNGGWLKGLAVLLFVAHLEA